MKLFVGNMVDPGDRPIINMTGLDGFFDIKLDWTPETEQGDSANRGPSILTAVQKQLGLRLEARKAPIEYFVIDHVERPPEN